MQQVFLKFTQLTRVILKVQKCKKTQHIPTETSYGLKVVESYMDKVLVFAQTEKYLV